MMPRHHAVKIASRGNASRHALTTLVSGEQSTGLLMRPEKDEAEARKCEAKNVCEAEAKTYEADIGQCLIDYATYKYLLLSYCI